MNMVMKGGSKVLVGTLAGFALALGLTPVLSRQYTPDVFGQFGVLTAAAATFIGLSTLRLEVIALAERDDARFATLATRGLHLSMSLGILLMLASAVATIFGVDQRWLIVGPLVVVGSWQLVGTAGLSRWRDYRGLALCTFSQQGGASFIQVLLGATGSVWGLVTGFFLARACWIPPIRRLHPNIRQARRPAETPWRQAVPAGMSALFNSLGTQMPLLLLASLYGTTSAGLFAMAQRLFSQPLQVLAQGIATASNAEVSHTIRSEDHAAASDLVRTTMRRLALLGAVPTVAVAVTAPWLAPIVLGENWQEAGGIISILSVSAYAQFCTAPFAQLLNVTGRSRTLLAWDCSRLMAITGALVAPKLFGGDLLTSMAALSLALTLTYTALGLLVDRAIPKQTRIFGTQSPH